MYDKETLELEDVRQMLQNNELIKKAYSTRRLQDWLSKVKGEDQRVRDPKRIQMLLVVLLDTTAGNHDTSRKII